MADGANRIFKVMQKTNTDTTSELVPLTVKTLNPLTVSIDDKLILTENFLEFNDDINKTKLTIGDKLLSAKYNNSQLYFIMQAIQSAQDIKNRGGSGAPTVVDNLTSTSSVDALSANMGRVLNENKLDNVKVNTNDSKFNDVKDIIGNNYQNRKTYLITNNPISDENYIQNGASHTVLGMEYDNQNYGSQISYSFVGIKFRTKNAGVWSSWHDVETTATNLVTKSLSATNWYRVACLNNQTSYAGSHGDSFIVFINTTYNHTNNTSIIATVNLTHNKVKIVPLNIQMNSTTVSQMRVVEGTDGKWYLEIYYQTSSANSVRVKIINTNNSQFGGMINFTTENTVQTTLASKAFFNDNINFEVVPANSDLNSYTTPGFYYSATNVNVATMSNVPEAKAFSLVVKRHAGVNQIFTTYETNNLKIYTRNFYNGTWGSWQDISPIITITNSNGTATKFPNGDMVCRGTYAISNVTPSASGSIYYNSGYTHTFPVSFIEAPQVTVSVKTGNLAWAANVIGTAASFSFAIIQQTNVVRSAEIEWMAIGRWK